jgi:hypothetical protein
MVDKRDDGSLGCQAESYELREGRQSRIGEGLLGVEVSHFWEEVRAMGLIVADGNRLWDVTVNALWLVVSVCVRRFLSGRAGRLYLYTSLERRVSAVDMLGIAAGAQSAAIPGGREKFEGDSVVVFARSTLLGWAREGLGTEREKMEVR